MSEQNTSVIIPNAKAKEIAILDGVLMESQEALRSSLGTTQRAFVTAASMKALEAAICGGILADIKNLMDSPIGFRTDRAPGTKKKNKETGKYEDVKPYHDLTIKRCVIVALLGGAELVGNQFNIIAGNCYFTKEFMLKQILNWPGLKRFEMELGAAKMNEGNTASMAGVASWELNGEFMELVAGREDSEGRLRPVITVNAYGSSGPDQLRGVGESKMLRRVFARLTGLNLDDGDAV